MMRCAGVLLVRAPVARARAQRAVIAQALQDEQRSYDKSYHSSGKPQQHHHTQLTHDAMSLSALGGEDEDTFHRHAPNTGGERRRDTHNNNDGSVEHVHSGMMVSSLPDFFTELRNMRRDVGNASFRDRNIARDNLTRFWNANIGFAMASCVRARDLGFVSFYGVSDSNLRMPPNLIMTAVQLLLRDKDVSSAFDTAVSLRYFAREISRVLTAPQSTAEDKAHLPPDIVSMFVDHGMERLNYFFVPRPGRPESSVVGRGEDAVHGLEFILSLGNGSAHAPMLTEVLLLKAARDDILMTSTISCFGILRASMSKLKKPTTAAICLELLRAVKRKDDKLKNSFHFVKILMTMVRIDSEYLRQPALWQYLIVKACIFVPNAAPEQRQLMVMAIRTMLHARELDALLSDLAHEIQHGLPEEYEKLIVGPIRELKRD